MIRVVCWLGTVKQVRNELEDEVSNLMIDWNKRHILHVNPAPPDTAKVLNTLVHMVDEGSVLKFTYWTSLKGVEDEEGEWK
jgi:hypothetical protein